MDLDQDVEAVVFGTVFEIAGQRIVDGGHDDQDCVRAPGTRFGHLIGVEQEILA